MNIKSNILYIFLSNAILGALGILFVPVALNRLGNEGFGIYAAYATLLSIVNLIDLGVIKNLTRKIAKVGEEKDSAERIRDVNTMYLLIVCLLLILIIPFSFVSSEFIFPTEQYKNSIRTITFIAALEFILTIPVNLVVAHATAHERFPAISRFNLLTGLVRYGLMLLVVYLTANPVLLALAIALRKPIELVLAILILENLPKRAWGLSKNIRAAGANFSESLSLSVSQILQMLVIAAGNIVVNRFFGIAALGSYRAAFDLASRVWFFSNGIGAVIFPRLVKMNSNIEQAKRLSLIMPIILKMSWYIYLIFGLLISLSATLIVGILGIDSNLVRDLFILIALGICFNAHANLGYENLQSTARYGVTARLALLSFIGMLTLFFLMRPFVGIYSIGYAWIGSQLIYAVATDIQIVKFTYKKYVTNIVLAILCVILVVDNIYNQKVMLSVLHFLLIIFLLLMVFAKQKYSRSVAL